MLKNWGVELSISQLQTHRNKEISVQGMLETNKGALVIQESIFDWKDWFLWILAPEFYSEFLEQDWILLLDSHT